MSLKELRNKLEQRKGEKAQIEKSIEEVEERIESNKKLLRRYEKARSIIQQVGLKTQEQLSYNISEITSMALNAVLDDPYNLQVEFVERRNKTECDIFFSRHGEMIDPFSGGGGAIDVAAFALRVASWSMQRPRTDNTLILDEPFKHLKGEEANKKMLEMVNQVSRKLGIQIIMVSDERVSRDATIEATNKLFEVYMEDGKSKIKVQ